MGDIKPFRIYVTQVLRSTLKNVVASAKWRQRFVHPYFTL